MERKLLDRKLPITKEKIKEIINKLSYNKKDCVFYWQGYCFLDLAYEVPWGRVIPKCKGVCASFRILRKKS